MSETKKWFGVVFGDIRRCRLLVTAALSISLTMLVSLDSVADDEPEKAKEESARLFHVEVKGGIAPPFLGGFFFQAEFNPGIQFRRLLAVQWHHSAVIEGFLGDGVKGQLLQLEAGLMPVFTDRRVNRKGWVSRIGGMLGWAFLFGETGSDESESYYRIKRHYLTLSVAVKTFHYWNRHVAFVFQGELMGGVSIHSYLFGPYEYDDSGAVPETIRDEFSWADEFLYGLRCTLGIAF